MFFNSRQAHSLHPRKYALIIYYAGIKHCAPCWESKDDMAGATGPSATYCHWNIVGTVGGQQSVCYSLPILQGPELSSHRISANLHTIIFCISDWFRNGYLSSVDPIRKLRTLVCCKQKRNPPSFLFSIRISVRKLVLGAMKIIFIP